MSGLIEVGHQKRQHFGTVTNQVSFQVGRELSADLVVTYMYRDMYVQSITENTEYLQNNFNANRISLILSNYIENLDFTASRITPSTTFL